MEREDFIKRLVELRMKKGVSARDMSLSLGQSPGYINNIETGVNFPSMTVFFYICEYLGITPQDFFNTASNNPIKINQIMKLSEGLNDDKLDLVINLLRELNN